MSIKDDLKSAETQISNSGITASFFNFFQGRATAFAILFTIFGIVGFLKHYDLTSYALFVTAVQGMVFAHSCKEDWASIKRQQIQQNVNVTVDDTKQ
jgi:hypothetical protein